MKLKSMFKRTVKGTPVEAGAAVPEVPEGLLKKCNACKSAVFVEDVRKNYYIFPHYYILNLSYHYYRIILLLILSMYC